MPNTDSATDFLQALNNVYPSLSFTMELEDDGSIPFLSTVLTRCDGTLTTEVYSKPTDTGLLLYFQSLVDRRYTRKAWSTRWLTVRTVYSPPKNVLQKNATSYAPCFQSCAIRKKIVDSNINRFSQELDEEIHPVPSADPSVSIELPRLRSAMSRSRTQGYLFSGSQDRCQRKARLYKQKTVTNPECQGKQTPDRKHSLRCVLISKWFVRCKLCRVHCPIDNYINAYVNTAIQPLEKTLKHSMATTEEILNTSFKVLRKCNGKFDRLVYEMLCTKDIMPSLYTQADSIRAKLFLLLLLLFFFLCFLPWGLYP